jgi:hypothetical protein
LNFSLLKQQAAIEVDQEGPVDKVHINRKHLPGNLLATDLDGLTIYVRDSSSARIFVDGIERSDIQRNFPDESGKPSVSIPWRRLSFPEVALSR